MTGEIVPADEPPRHWMGLTQEDFAIQEFRGPLMPGREYQLYVDAHPEAGSRVFDLAEMMSTQTHLEHLDDNRTTRFVFAGLTLGMLWVLSLVAFVAVVLLFSGYPREGGAAAVVTAVTWILQQGVSLGRRRRDKDSERLDRE